MESLYKYSEILLKKCYFRCLIRNISNGKKKYLTTKYKHSFNTLKVAKKIYNIKTQEEESLYLLHDIGRFMVVLDSVENIDHAKYGYEYLKKLNRYDEKILLPILLHETDVNWQEKLCSMKLYKGMKQEDKNEILQNIERLKDADIISNMLEKLRHTKHDEELNDHIYNSLINGKICEKDYEGNLNRALYIICGIYILSTRESLAFIKQSGLVVKYFDKVIATTKNFEIKYKLMKCREYLIEKKYI